MICRSEVIFFYYNKNKKKEVVKENVNSRLLVSTLNKTNKNISTIMGIIFLNNKGIVFRKVDTLMEVRNMNEEFQEASGKMKEALMKLELLLKKWRMSKMKKISIGDELATKKEYKERVSFLLNEILEYGLLEYQRDLEYLYDFVDGNKVYEIQCKVGDYIYLNK